MYRFVGYIHSSFKIVGGYIMLYPQASNCLVANLKVSGKCSLKASLGPFYVDYVDGFERILDWLKMCIRFFFSPENTY